MKIKYTTKSRAGPDQTDWSKIKIGDRVIIYEGWNVDVHRERYGLVGLVNRVTREHTSLCQNSQNCPVFGVKYEGLDQDSVIYPYESENRKVRGIILK